MLKQVRCFGPSATDPVHVLVYWCHVCCLRFRRDNFMDTNCLTTQVMLNFYRAVIESVLTFSISVWFGSITQKETLRLNRVVKTVSRIIGRDLPSLEILYQQRLLGRATLISQDTSHPAHDLFEPLPSSRRFRSIKTRTNRFSTSFCPLAVQALSKQK